MKKKKTEKLVFELHAICPGNEEEGNKLTNNIKTWPMTVVTEDQSYQTKHASVCERTIKLLCTLPFILQRETVIKIPKLDAIKRVGKPKQRERHKKAKPAQPAHTGYNGSAETGKRVDIIMNEKYSQPINGWK